MSDKITLRYFDVRGRAQFLRYYLSVRNIDYTDERIPVEADFSSWTAVKQDHSLTGPFGKLPVMHWNDTTIAEALVIADTLHTRCGDAAILGSTENLQHRQLLSHLYEDIANPITTLIWSDILYPDADFSNSSRSVAENIAGQLSTLEKTLNDWAWRRHSDIRPLMVADCLLWECLDVCKLVFGDYLDALELPTLDAIHQRYANGTAFSGLLSTHSCSVTARQDESTVIDRIKSALTMTV